NTAITPNVATLALGTPPITYTVAPALPAGLTINSSSGNITGTPTGTAMSKLTYVVTAKNAQGPTTASVKIGTSLTLPKPDYTGYTINNAEYLVGVTIATNSPINGG